MKRNALRGSWPFKFALVACVQFVVLTAIAMPLYPGGSFADPTSTRYSFFNNFLSELGMTVTSGGYPNIPSTVLFVITLTWAGLGLVVFFVAAPQFFRRHRLAFILSIVGTIFGVISGLSYVGVAFTPANLLEEAHYHFVLTAFRAFLVVVIFYSAAILADKDYPDGYSLAYIGFAVLLGAYIWLMTRGPGFDTPEGVMIQATGQKVIVYAAIVCTFVQSYGALRLKNLEVGGE
jgi:hypothetical protein